MEENTSSNKLSYEQLEAVALQFQQRALQAETRLSTIDFAAMRLQYLFRVLDISSVFPQQFISDCVTEIMNIMTINNDEADDTVKK